VLLDEEVDVLLFDELLLLLFFEKMDGKNPILKRI